MGSTSVPPFEIAETAVINCNGVIENLCPKDIVASSTGPTLSKGVKYDFGVLAIFDPILSKNPYASKYLYNVLTPIFCPNCIKAGLQDFSNAFLKDKYP